MGFSLINVSNCFADTNFYRYKDKDGHPVITNSLPSEVADQGYEIISPRGNVIETVQPAKSKEEIAKDAKELEEKRIKELKEQAQQKLAEIQAKKDDILLKSFTSEEDIKRSRDDKIASIAVLEEITNENITRLKKQLEHANLSKSNYEKNGQKIPADLQKTIDESNRQIQDNMAFLERKKVEKDKINTDYKDLLQRFHQLHQQEKATPVSK